MNESIKVSTNQSNWDNSWTDWMWRDYGSATCQSFIVASTSLNYSMTTEKECVKVTIIAPGLIKDTIEVSYNPNARALLLSGTKKAGVYVGNNELPKTLAIYKDVDHLNATANYEDGILTILLPYKAELRSSRINVK